MKKYVADNEVNAEILRRVANGEPRDEIAKAIGLSHGAVRQRVYMMRTLGMLDVLKPLGRRPRPQEAWERLHAELAETHRREFLETVYGNAWRQLG